MKKHVYPTKPHLSPRVVFFAVFCQAVYWIYTDAIGSTTEMILILLCIVLALLTDAVCCALQRVANAMDRIGEKPPIVMTGISFGGKAKIIEGSEANGRPDQH